MIQATGVFIPPSSFLPGELIAPKGTRIPFNQSAAPLGWVTDTAGSLSDCTATVRSGSGGASGGSSAWSGWNFGGTRNANAVTLSVANMPSHTHTVNDPTHGHAASNGGNFYVSGVFNCGTNQALNAIGNANVTSGTNGASAGVNVSNAGSSSPFTPTIPAPQVKFTDLIICVRQS